MAAQCFGTWPSANDLSTGPFPVQEGYFLGVLFRPDGKTIAAGYIVADFGLAEVAWCCGTWPHANAWSTTHSR